MFIADEILPSIGSTSQHISEHGFDQFSVYILNSRMVAFPVKTSMVGVCGSHSKDHTYLPILPLFIFFICIVSYSFESLKGQAPETACYIRIENTAISYPVMWSEEDGFYLTHAFDGTNNRNGATYLSV